ncbi:MAG TPA: PepSY domain-containing protein [Chloroflexi bacterium]|jgi:hypothetical protein|nr:PepSY domain-containing protein [Chloroflexota bacterium]
MRNNHVQQALNNTLSSLYVTEQTASDLLAQAKGGRKVKRKLSVAMVLTIVLIVLAATAIAITMLWENHVIDVKKKEISEGEYFAWEIKSKRDLVKSLVEMGYIQESEQTRELFNQSTEPQKQEEIADNLMLALTGQTDAREINADIITYAIFGPESTWTPAQRVWWQQVTNMFRNADDDLDSFVLAEQEDLPEEKAVSIAKDAIIKAYALPSDALDNAQPVANLYTTKARPDYRRWDVQFQLFKDDNPDWVIKVYFANLDMQGNLISDPDLGIPHIDDAAKNTKDLPLVYEPPLVKEFLRYAKKAGKPTLRWWPLEIRAEFSNAMRDRVLDALKSGDLQQLTRGTALHMEMITGAHYVYGLPDKDAIKQEKALDQAKSIIQKKFGLTTEAIDSYEEILVYFDVTSSDNPLWRFVFQPQELHEMMMYRIEIDAKTGNVVNAEEFQFQSLGPNLDELDYHLKVY